MVLLPGERVAACDRKLDALTDDVVEKLVERDVLQLGCLID
jgi:hypothetical protein